jgi:hypothetical protein
MWACWLNQQYLNPVDTGVGFLDQKVCYFDGQDHLGNWILQIGGSESDALQKIPAKLFGERRVARGIQL